MFDSCDKKVDTVKKLFQHCKSEDEKYRTIIELGRSSPRLDNRWKTSENLVKGCQSVMHLHSSLKGDKVMFEAEADALISSGLAVLLTMVYSGEAPESILKYPPQYLEEIGITASLTPNRANGLYSMHLRMKQDALRLLVEKQA